MWNWLKNLFRGKRGSGQSKEGVAGQPIPKAPEEREEQKGENTSGEQN